ncbi:MAG: 2-oxoacid:acceptor oxidoreductase subunit alpha [Myxococcota bacterium]|nr:2-oxoacid:acceptor oxidoreductase subunit alpha [Myxococcota bacterium]
MQKNVETIERDAVAIRFAGDSGDGMQLTGSQFTETATIVGNDIATFPDYPAEIRAPAGTLAGVSGYQLNFSANDIFTHGDSPDVLVAMNPAALKANLADLKPDGILIANTAAFTDKNLGKVGYDANPLEDGSLSAYRVYPVDITTLTLNAIAECGLNQRAAVRSKNFFALGLVYWMFNRPLEHSLQWIDAKFRARDEVVANANTLALKAGYFYGETAEIFTHNYIVKRAQLKPGRYRGISGNEATALGFLTASELSGLDLFLGSYPITPASDILHYLSKQKHLGVKTFQAEDEIAGVCSAIGAAYAGALAMTTTSGPGIALKGEAIGLAAITELPLIIINIQRGGPSTGLPTKTEQSDLLQAMFGRNGDCPIPIIAGSTPGDCFHAALEAARIAVRHTMPVMLLTDGYLANGSEPWLIPDLDALAPFDVKFHTDPEGFQPYSRDENLARPWAIPGTPYLEHRLGGLEKEHLTGNVSYDPQNHEFMTKLRAEKVERVADHIPPIEVFGPDDGDVLVLGWGSTFGAIRAAVSSLQATGAPVAHVHLRHLNPFPRDLGDVLKRYKRVILPEMNMGQLALLLRAKYLVDIESFTKIQGKPFKEGELIERISNALEAVK